MPGAESVVVKEEAPGAKLEYHQHEGHMKYMEEIMDKCKGSDPVVVIGAAALGYFFGKENRHGHGGHGRDGHYGYDGRGGEDCCLVNKFELKQAELLACKEAELAKERAEKFAILGDIAVGKEVGELKSELKALKQYVVDKVQCLEKADKDVLEDAIGYAKCHFVPGKLVLPNTPTVTGFAADCCPAPTPTAA